MTSGPDAWDAALESQSQPSDEGRSSKSNDDDAVVDSTASGQDWTGQASGRASGQDQARQQRPLARIGPAATVSGQDWTGQGSGTASGQDQARQQRPLARIGPAATVSGQDWTGQGSGTASGQDQARQQRPLARIGQAATASGQDGEASPTATDTEPIATMPDVEYWQKYLLAAGRGRRARLGKQKRPLLIASLCSGSLPEDLCCTALDVDYEVAAASDPKPAALKFAQENRNMAKVPHWFEDMESIVWGSGACMLHGTTCSADARREDIGVAGLPCQPVSVQSAKRFRSGGVVEHPKFYLYGQFVNYLRERSPRCGVFEQVLGFGTAAPGMEQTPLQKLSADIAELGCYSLRILQVNVQKFIDIARPRCQPALPATTHGRGLIRRSL